MGYYMNNHIYLILSGILVGACMILPGVSGSIVAIVLGVYEQFIFILNDKNSSYLEKLRKIFPLIVGILIGIFIFGKILLYFYGAYNYIMMYVFIGLIMGSVPMLISEIKKKNENVSIKCASLALILSLLLLTIPELLEIRIDRGSDLIRLFIGGFLYIGGKIIPGISSSFFLIVLGLYDYLLDFVANPFNVTMNKIIFLFPFFFGIIVGMFIFIKLINLLIKKYFSATFSCIIGFIFSSVILMFPGIKFNIEGLAGIVLLLCSYVLVVKLTKK